MKVLVTVFRAASIVAGLLGVGSLALLLLVVAWASTSGDSGAGMLAYALMLFVPPVVSVLTSVGFVGVLLTGRVAHPR